MSTHKNILFDLVAVQPNGAGKRHGAGKYGEMIFFRMIERNERFACFYDSRKWLNPEVKCKIEENNLVLFDISKQCLSDIVDKYQIDTVYSALPSNDVLELRCCRVIATLHGLRNLETPIDSFFFRYSTSFKEKVKFFLRKYAGHIWEKNAFKRYFNKHTEIVTVSEHSRYALLSYFPSQINDIKVFYSPNTSSSIKAEKDSSAQRYFFMVSGNRWDKNNLRAIMAFDRLVSSGLIKDVKVKITGCSPSNFKYKLQNPEFFEFMGYVDESELEQLYANAYIFVYPSLNEGFGYPPLEAMRYGIPVIGSPFSSISELFEGSILYFNPLSIEEIMNRMLIMMQPNRYSEYSRLGLERYVKIKERQDRDLNSLIDWIMK